MTASFSGRKRRPIGQRVILAGFGLVVCSPPACGDRTVDAERVVRPIVHGTDDRREFFESSPEERGLIQASMVALISKRRLEISDGGAVRVTGPTLAAKAGLCPREAFGEQPGAALCSGVLVDWALVLTAGHCARAVPREDLAVVFGYYYRDAGQLALSERDIHDVAGVAADRESVSDARPHFDYAWLRLRTSVRPPRAPVAIRMDVARLSPGTAITFLGTGGGVPIKTDRGGLVADAGLPWRDLFLASTDTAAGASGGGAFDDELVLTGILEGGGLDYVVTDEGCKRVFRPAADARPEETFTYASAALQGLCAAAPQASTLCRPACGDPCRALDPDALPESPGCTFTPAHTRPFCGWVIALLAAIVLAARRGHA
jgi:hypothetical protein